MRSFILALCAAAIVSAQNVPPPSPVRLTTTKSAVLPVLPTNFNGVDTLQGAIISKAPANASYTPVNGPAVAQSNVPQATYVATLPAVPFNGLTGTVIRGTVSGSAGPNGVGVQITVNVTGLPSLSQYGPFAYHIHNSPVPSDGNCTSTLAHFDYTNAGEYYTCNTATPQNCQTGDLSGKHGRINTTSTSYSTTYVDNYLSTDPSSPYYFGSLSVVFHTSNTTRLTCANFMRMGGAASSSTATGSTPVQTYTGAAVKTAVSGAFAGLAGLLGMLMM